VPQPDASARHCENHEQLQAPISTNADQSQLDVLENGCGIYLWDSATIVQHSGPDALDLLHRLTTKGLLSVGEGQSRRTALTSDRGRVVDVFLVANIAENQLLLVSDSPNSERVVSAIDYYTIIEDAELTDLSESHTRISLIGPNARRTVESALNTALEPNTVVQIDFEDAPVYVISDTSRGPGIEWIDVIYGTAVFSRLVSAFENAGGIAVDTHNFELFRICNAIPGSDREYGEHANPIEAGLLHLIDWDKGCYVGQEVIARLDAYDKVQRNVKVLKSAAPLEEGTKLTSDSKPAGVVTSASQLKPQNGEYLSLALVRKAFLGSATVLDADGTTATVS
jgi:folate-binding protein YgfZ